MDYRLFSICIFFWSLHYTSLPLHILAVGKYSIEKCGGKNVWSALCMRQITTIPRNFQFCKVRIYTLCVCVVLPSSNFYLSIHWLFQINLDVNILLWMIPNLHILGSSYRMTLVKINLSVRMKTCHCFKK